MVEFKMEVRVGINGESRLKRDQDKEEEDDNDTDNNYNNDTQSDSNSDRDDDDRETTFSFSKGWAAFHERSRHYTDGGRGANLYSPTLGTQRSRS